MTDAAPCAMSSGLRSSSVSAGVLTLVLNNTLDAIEDGRLELLRHLAPLALGARAINRLEVVFEEVVANVVRHGFRPESDQTLRVQAAADDDEITLVFEDDGLRFNPLKPPRRDANAVGGRGLPAVMKIATTARYEALPSGNRLILTLATKP